jgi:peptide/nickel transport system substrate-binding protein
MNAPRSLHRGRRPGRRPGSLRSRTAMTAAALCLGLALAGAAAGAPGAASAASSSGSTLRVEADTAFSTFNPFTAYFDADLNVIASIYPTLTLVNAQSHTAPYLASKWTVSPDKLTWTFTIRSGL